MKKARLLLPTGTIISLAGVIVGGNSGVNQRLRPKGYNLSVKSNSAPAIKRGERLFKAPQLVSTANNTKSKIPTISVKRYTLIMGTERGNNGN